MQHKAPFWRKKELPAATAVKWWVQAKNVVIRKLLKSRRFQESVRSNLLVLFRFHCQYNPSVGAMSSTPRPLLTYDESMINQSIIGLRKLFS